MRSWSFAAPRETQSGPFAWGSFSGVSSFFCSSMALAAVEQLPWVLRQVFTSKLLPCQCQAPPLRGQSNGSCCCNIWMLWKKFPWQLSGPLCPQCNDEAVSQPGWAPPHHLHVGHSFGVPVVLGSREAGCPLLNVGSICTTGTSPIQCRLLLEGQEHRAHST